MKPAAIFVVAILLILIGAAIVMLLWNHALQPAVPALVQIGYLQALGIWILCAMLFKPNMKITKSG